MNNTMTLKMNTNTQDHYIKNIVIVGLCMLAVIVSMYMYFVGKIVFDVVARRQAETSIKLAQSSVGNLQVAYLAQLDNLDLASAAASGLVESKDTMYATRDTAPTVGMLQ